MSDVHAHAHCFMCGYPLYYRPSVDRPFPGRAWCHLHWRVELHDPQRIDPVCCECFRIGEALRNMFRDLRWALKTDYRKHRKHQQPTLLTHHTKPLL